MQKQKSAQNRRGRVFDGPRKPRTAKNKAARAAHPENAEGRSNERFAGTDRYADRHANHTGSRAGASGKARAGRDERYSSDRQRSGERAGRPERFGRDGRDGRGRGAGEQNGRGYRSHGESDAREYRGGRPERNASYRGRQEDRRTSRDSGERGARTWRDDERGDERRGGANNHSNGHDGGRNGDRPRWEERNDRRYHSRRDQGSPSRGGYQRDDHEGRDNRSSRFDRNGRSEHRNHFDRDERFGRNDRNDRFDHVNRDDRTGRPERKNRNDRFDRPRRNGRDDRRTSFGHNDRNDRSNHDRYTGRPHQRTSDAAHADRVAPVHHALAHQEDVKLEKLAAIVESAEELSGSFAELGVDDRVIAKLGEMGISTPFPIQSATIPDAIAGRNVLGRGRTGSGKTVAFAAPIVTRLQTLERNTKRGRAPRALIVAPTRELANQIDKTVQPLARAAGLFTIAIYGGVPQFKQVTALTRGVDIVIATPGRLEDLVEQGYIDLAEMKITVLDEADHMCELGFLEPIQRILRAVDPAGQRMLFSATLDAEVAQLVDEFLPDPLVHEVAGEDQDSGTIEHTVLVVDPRDKVSMIEQLVAGAERSIVFTRTRAYAETLCMDLEDAGIPATSLHGDLNQARRTRNLARLTSGKVDVLVATDVAARGIHIDDISLVIQADAPDEYKTYLHRSGRTGRAGKPGQVVTLIPRGRRRRMNDLLTRAEIKAPMIEARPGDDLLEQLAH